MWPSEEKELRLRGVVVLIPFWLGFTSAQPVNISCLKLRLAHRDAGCCVAPDGEYVSLRANVSTLSVSCAELLALHDASLCCDVDDALLSTTTILLEEAPAPPLAPSPPPPASPASPPQDYSPSPVLPPPPPSESTPPVLLNVTHDIPPQPPSPFPPTSPPSVPPLSPPPPTPPSPTFTYTIPKTHTDNYDDYEGTTIAGESLYQLDGLCEPSVQQDEWYSRTTAIMATRLPKSNAQCLSSPSRTHQSRCRAYVTASPNCANSAHATARACPIILGLHGSGGCGARDGHRQLSMATGSFSPDYDYIAVVLEGSDATWLTNNAGIIAHNDTTGGGNNDPYYVLAVLDRLVELGFTGRRYAVGFSNGAQMTQYLGVNSGSFGIAGIAPAATSLQVQPASYGKLCSIHSAPSINCHTHYHPYDAATSVRARDNAATNGDATYATRRVAVFMYHNTIDSITRFGGNQNFMSFGFDTSKSTDAADYWAELNGCGTTFYSASGIEPGGVEVTMRTYTGCLNGPHQVKHVTAHCHPGNHKGWPVPGIQVPMGTFISNPVLQFFMDVETACRSASQGTCPYGSGLTGDDAVHYPATGAVGIDTGYNLPSNTTLAMDLAYLDPAC